MHCTVYSEVWGDEKEIWNANFKEPNVSKKKNKRWERGRLICAVLLLTKSSRSLDHQSLVTLTNWVFESNGSFKDSSNLMNVNFIWIPTFQLSPPWSRSDGQFGKACTPIVAQIVTHAESTLWNDHLITHWDDHCDESKWHLSHRSQMEATRSLQWNSCSVWSDLPSLGGMIPRVSRPGTCRDWPQLIPHLTAYSSRSLFEASRRSSEAEGPPIHWHSAMIPNEKI